MKRKASITVRSTAAAYTAEGTFERTGEGFLLVYDEPAELDMGGVTTSLRVSEGRAVLTRTGAVRSEFRFAEGAPHSSVYETPHGSFPAEVVTHALRSKLDARGALIDLRYTLTIGGAADEHRLKLLIRTEGNEG